METLLSLLHTHWDHEPNRRTPLPFGRGEGEASAALFNLSFMESLDVQGTRIGTLNRSTEHLPLLHWRRGPRRGGLRTYWTTVHGKRRNEGNFAANHLQDHRMCPPIP